MKGEEHPTRWWLLHVGSLIGKTVNIAETRVTPVTSIVRSDLRAPGTASPIRAALSYLERMEYRLESLRRMPIPQGTGTPTECPQARALLALTEELRGISICAGDRATGLLRTLWDGPSDKDRATLVQDLLIDLARAADAACRHVLAGRAS